MALPYGLPPVFFEAKLICCAGLFSFCNYRFDIQPQPLRHAGAVSRICIVEMPYLQFLNALWDAIAEAGDNVVDEPLPRIRGHKPEQISWLRVVVDVGSVIVPCNRAAHGMRAFDIQVILRRAAEAVSLVARSRAAVPVQAHRTILVIRVVPALRTRH